MATILQSFSNIHNNQSSLVTWRVCLKQHVPSSSEQCTFVSDSSLHPYNSVMSKSFVSPRVSIMSKSSMLPPVSIIFSSCSSDKSCHYCSYHCRSGSQSHRQLLQPFSYCKDLSALTLSSISLSPSNKNRDSLKFLNSSQLAAKFSTRKGIFLNSFLTNMNVSCKAQAGSSNPVSEAEKEGWTKRQDEAGKENDNGSWQWSLNWDQITSNIVVGSCPRSPEDVDSMVDQAGITAILNLQSNLCFEALKIPFEGIRKRAIERGVYLERVAIRDFDHGDQALMLPQAVRTLNILLARGFKVYVHCTAGINRATLTTVGYLTFVQGMTLDDAISLVKSARKVAHPYIDCWVEVRRRLLDGRNEEVTGVSKQIYELRKGMAAPGNSSSDWEAAQKQVIASTFGRWLEVDLGILQMELDQLDRQYAATLRKVKADFEKDLGQSMVNAKKVAFSLAKHVAENSVSSISEVSEEELECDVVTRECISPSEE